MNALNGLSPRSIRRATTLAGLCAFLTIPASPTSLAGQERDDRRAFPRTELDSALDSLATDRAQALNQAYYNYEQALEGVRREAERLERPSLFTERRQELRRELESRVLRIERRYEQRRADLLERHVGRRFEGGEADDRFGKRIGDAGQRPAPRAGDPREELPGMGRTEMAELNAELAEAWAEFHERARELRSRARTDEDWDGYEAAITELENEYRDRVAEIQRRQRQLRFEMERARWRDTTAAPRRGQTTP